MRPPRCNPELRWLPWLSRPITRCINGLPAGVLLDAHRQVQRYWYSYLYQNSRVPWQNLLSVVSRNARDLWIWRCSWIYPINAGVLFHVHWYSGQESRPNRASWRCCSLHPSTKLLAITVAAAPAHYLQIGCWHGNCAVRSRFVLTDPGDGLVHSLNCHTTAMSPKSAVTAAEIEEKFDLSEEDIT